MSAAFLMLSLVIGLMLVTDTQGQVGPTPTPRANDIEPESLKPERGIVLTVRRTYTTPQEAAQIRSIPRIPYYDPWDGLVPGIKFTDPDIHFLSVDVDFQSKSLFLYDYYFKSIAIGNQFNPDLKLDNMTFEFMHAGVSQATVQVAYDWHSRTLYWVDPGFGWIIAAPGNASRIDEDLYKIIVRDDLDKPDGIALDPFEGLLFWSDSGITKKIERITLSGENRTTIVASNLKSPRALEADHVSKRLFWLDNIKEEIESVNYDGTGRKVVRRIAGSNMFDIAIYREMAIISDISDGRIYFLNKTSGGLMYSSIRIGSETTYGIAVYSEDDQPGSGLGDDCAALSCPHLCLSTGTTNTNSGPKAKCVCAEGFEYSPQNKTCIEQAGSYHRAIILMNNTDICYGDLRSLASYSYNATCVFTTTKPEIWYLNGTTTTTAPPSLPAHQSTTQRPRSTTTTTRPFPPETILFMELDIEERILYFASTNNIYTRSVDERTYANIKTRVTATNLNISGLAYDWIDRYNLYYSTTIGYIYVKNVKDTSVRRILMSPSNGYVENLVLLPHKRQLAWTSLIGGITSKIEIANLSSSYSNVVTLVGGRSPIKSLTYDQHRKIFYWIESQYVYQYDPDVGGTPTAIHFDSEDTAFYLQMYRNSLIVAEVYTNSTLTHIKTIDVTSTADMKPVKAEGTIPNVPGISHFKILDITLQPSEASFCKDNNGYCEQLCQTIHDGNGNMQKTCSCQYGFQLQPDGRSCKSPPQKDFDFLLVADMTNEQINQVNLKTEEFRAVDVQQPGRPKALVYDHKRERVIFGLEDDEKIYSAKLDEEGSEIFLELDFFTIPNRFALDETTGNIYFTSTYYDYIGLLTPQQTSIELRMDNLFLADVSSIALHPQRGYMYYGVRDFSYSYIGRAAMDGTGSLKLISPNSITNIRWPDGIAIDYTSDHLYWADRYYDTISRCDLDARTCSVIYDDPGADINDIATDGTFLYFTTYGKGLFKIDLRSSSTVASKMGTETETGRLGSLSLYNSNNTQPVSDGCKANNGKGPCSTICLPKPYGQYACACETGVNFKPGSMTTCDDVFQCEEFIGNAQAPSSCSRLADTWCDLLCQPGYVKISETTNMTHFCSNVGWNVNAALCKEGVCSLIISKVTFANSCTGKIGETCSYTCVSGFSPTKRSAHCLRNAEWDTADNEFCKASNETLCNRTAIANGAFSGTCEGKVNVACQYTCNQYYTPSLSPSTMTCLPSGTWDKNVTTACQAVACPTSLGNGALANSCTSRNVGSNCGFTCNTGYVNTTNEVVCTTTGTWSPSNACKHKPCPTSMKNGQFIDSCSGEYSTSCQFSCTSPYYKPTVNDLTVSCGENGLWLRGNIVMDVDNLCTEILCNTTIPNAAISPTCDRKVMSTCDFTCNSGYEKAIGVSKATCMASGEWSDMTACIQSCGTGQFRCASGLCIPAEKKCDGVNDCDDGSDEGSVCAVTCPATITKGTLLSCDKKVGKKCNFTCEPGYSKTTADLICLNNGEWHTTIPCQAIVCPMTVNNGKISTDCTTRNIGDTCKIVCNDGYALDGKIYSGGVTCLNTGQWNVTSEPCTAIMVNPQEQRSAPGGVNTGAVVGAVIAVIVALVVLAAVVAFVLYKRRLQPGMFRSSSPSAKYSTSDIAIENPGYMNADINVTDDTGRDNPYDNPNQYQPAFNGGPDTQGGYVNPMYASKARAEPLAEQGDVEIHHDDVVLTTDSWQKEQLKGPEA